MNQNYTPMVLYEEIFLCISTLLYMTNFFCIRIGTLFLYVTRSNPIYIQRSFLFFSNAHLWFIQKFLYIYSFTHTRIHLHVFFIKTLLCTFSFFFIYVDILFTTFLSFFIMILVHFIFRTTFLNEKILRDSRISTNTIDNNETSTNVTTQTIFMHKTNGNRNNKNKR